MNDASAPELTPEQLRTMGDATGAQRDELRQLLDTRGWPAGFRGQLFADITLDRGLSSTRAEHAIGHLKRMPMAVPEDLRATEQQATEILELIRTRLTPSQIAKTFRTQLETRTMRADRAEIHLKDLHRLPLREFPLHARTGAPVNSDLVPDGKYAVVDLTGRSLHYRVTTDAIGCRILKHLNGPKKRRVVTQPSEVEKILEQIALDPNASLRRYARESKRCAAVNCNRPLHDTTQPGYAEGYGPDCWKKIVARKKIAEHRAHIPDGDD